jgi:2'-5' RNA ligase
MENISPDNKTYYKPPGLFEYLLIVSPGKEVYDKVMEEKQYFSNTYGQTIAIKTKPHLTISNFLAWDTMEHTLTLWMQRIAKRQRSFTVTLNNYSGFPSHTIFLRVLDPGPFNELTLCFKAIDPYIKDWSGSPARFMYYPHISIARRLPAAVYENAIKDYSEKDFNASFNVTELVLLRRQHQYDKCKEVGVFRLQPNEYNN